jgi:hypothetical protein
MSSALVGRSAAVFTASYTGSDPYAGSGPPMSAAMAASAAMDALFIPRS